MRTPRAYSTSTWCSDSPMRQVLDRRQDAHLALLPGVHDVVGVADLDRLGVLPEVGEHHANFVHQVVKGNGRDVVTVHHAAKHIGRGHCGPAAVLDGLVTPLVVAVAQVLYEMLRGSQARPAGARAGRP